MRILFVAHGYPPRETAGTEQHVASLARAATDAGHVVHVLAATRSAGHRPYETWTESVDGIAVTRIVNNLPTRPLGDGESDSVIDHIAAELQARMNPDVVHIHHLQFLSTSIRWAAPVVVTLHDQWFWCAAGGLGVQQDGTMCLGPAPSSCAPCASSWSPSPGRLARLLGRTAQRLAPVVSPDRLHRLWQSIPTTVRPRPERGQGPADPAPHAARRNDAMRKVLRTATHIVSPSQWLADRCTAVTDLPVTVIPHGLDQAWFEPRVPSPRANVLFLGTIAAHKGPSDVVQAWRQACPDGTPPLKIHGPVQDASLTLGHPTAGRLNPEGVRSALDQARVLVIGSTWHENAPLVVLEARARGCPIVATRVGGIPELIEASDGLLVPPHNPPEMAAAIRTVLGQPSWQPRRPPQIQSQAAALFDVLQEAASR